MAGDEAAHVVVDAACMGHGGQCIEDGAGEGLLGHVQGDAVGSQGLAVGGLHGQMQHDLVTQCMCLLGQGSRIGGVGEEGQRQRVGKFHHLLIRVLMITDVIDDDGQQWPPPGMSRGHWHGDEQQQRE